IGRGEPVADLVQEVFVRALGGIQRLRNPAKLWSWLDRKSVVEGKRGDLGDWGSGVGSSDLHGAGRAGRGPGAGSVRARARRHPAAAQPRQALELARSEERRGGKEGRSR